MRAVAMNDAAEGHPASEVGTGEVDTGEVGKSAVGKIDNPFTIVHYQDLLSELRSGLAERARAEQELAALESGAQGFSPGSPEAAQRELAAQYQSSLALADKQHALERQALDGRYQSATDVAAISFSQESGAI